MENNNADSILIKAPTTFAEQVELLRKRNLIVEDRDEAIGILSRVNYYRLSAYMLSYKQDDQFIGKVSIKDIYNLYQFDKKFRQLVSGLLESIEIAFRTQISHHLAHTYGSMCYLDDHVFANENIHHDNKNKLLGEIDRSDEVFIQHHKSKYDKNYPIWVAFEVASFGLISRIFSNMKNEDKQKISKDYYGLPYTYVKSWLYALSMFRNKCAHHSRTYNIKLTIKPKIHKQDVNRGVNNNQVFSILFVMKKLIQDPEEWDAFVTNLEALIETYDQVDITLMGFPEKWETILRYNE